MAFAGEQAGGRVEADPAGAGQVDLAPGVQVGEVRLRCRVGPSSDFTSARELDQVARDEARREAEVAQQLHQQPARSRGTSRDAFVQRLLGRLHAGLHADEVADVAAAAAG